MPNAESTAASGELLRCSFDDLILEAWCAHEKRLAAECEGDCCQAPLTATWKQTLAPDLLFPVCVYPAITAKRSARRLIA